MTAQEDVPKEPKDMEKEEQILPKEGLEEVNLRADLGNLSPILISSQLSVQEKKTTRRTIEEIWRFICNLNEACPKDKFPLPNIDLLIYPTKATTISTKKRHTTVKELKSFLEKFLTLGTSHQDQPWSLVDYPNYWKRGMFFNGELSNQMSFIKFQQIMSHLSILWILVHGKITIIVPGILIPSIYNIERHRNEVSQHRNGVFGGHASQQLNHYFSSHQILLMTSSHPIKALLHQPLWSWRVAQWLILLFQYNMGLKDF